MHGRKLILLAGITLLAACVDFTDSRGGETRTLRQSVEFEAVPQLRTEIRMPAGNLQVSGGTARIADGEFAFHDPRLEPKMEFRSGDGGGSLKVEPAREISSAKLSGTNRWILRLNDEIPTDLYVQLGAGESKLDLAGLTLSAVRLEMGVGKCEMNLVGEWDRDLEVEIKGGVGELSVRVPNHVGVIADAQGGIGRVNVEGLQREDGKYVNEAYGDSAVTLRLEIKGGIGQINVIAAD